MNNLKTAIYAFFIVQIGIIIAFWWTASGYLLTNSLPDFFISIGKVTGLLAVYFVLLQLILRARITLLENAIGFEELNSVHKKNGYLILALILTHPIFLTIGYSMYSSTSFITQFLNFLTDYPDTLNAFIGLVMFIGVIISSIYIVRLKLKYEFWYFVHLLTYVAIAFSWGHQLKNGSDFAINKWLVYYWYGLYGLTIFSILYWRVFRLLYINNKHKFYVKNIIHETADAVSIEISGQHLDSFYFEPGQFAMFRFLNKKFWWQSHPFSFSALHNTDTLRITVKKVGDFTSLIDTIQIGTKVFIDGPHGSFILREAKKNKILCVAGGVGITPIRALIEDAVIKKKDVVLIYGNKTSSDIIFKKELETLSQQYNFPIFHVISRDANYKGLTGRVDGTLVNKLVPDIDERDIYICGPVGMPIALRSDLMKEGILSKQIHFERFAL